MPGGLKGPVDAPLRTAAKLGGVVCLMVGLAYASVPFYDWFCRVTGFGGATGVSEVAASEVLDQEITIRFDAGLEADMPWFFKPETRTMKIKIGETGLAFYEAYNPTNRAVAGSASYNVAPYQAGGFFSKIDCFCFEEQVLQPGERVMMPVTFYVDPEIVDDREGQYIHTITLSYTFYEIDLPEDADQAALGADDAAPDGASYN
ncbi:MAG: cytochrome c oxidase assembly protein [Pseudomonadota bacterium]